MLRSFLFLSAFVLLISASGCLRKASMGARDAGVVASKEECQALYSSGSNIGGGFKGEMFLARWQDGRCVVWIRGEGGPVDAEEGHKQTVGAIKEFGSLLGTVAGDAAAGAR